MPALAMADDNPEPGAPIAKDAIDPDLVRLRRAAPQVSIITSLGLVVLCVTLLIRLRHDVGYAREGAARPVTAADIVAGKVPTNSFVTLDAPADRATAVRLRVSKGSSGNRVAAVHGTADKLWVALPGDAWDNPDQHDARVSGRLRRLSEARLADALADGLAAYPAPRFVSGAELKRARDAGAGQVTLLDGSPLTIAANDTIDFSVIDPGAAVVVAALSEGHTTPAAWAEALAAAGIITAGQAPDSTGKDLVRWTVRRPDAVAAVQAALDAAQLDGAHAEPSATNFRAAWSALATSAAGVKGPTGDIPWAAIDVAGVWAPRPVPAGAWVVLTDEHPADFWYMQPIFVGLVLIGLLSMWALVRAVRRTFFDQPVVAR